MYDHEATLDGMVQAFRNFAIMSMMIKPKDADEALDTVSRAESIGPFLDPTAFVRDDAFSRLDRQRKLIEVFIRTRNDLSELFPDLKLWLQTEAQP